MSTRTVALRLATEGDLDEAVKIEKLLDGLSDDDAETVLRKVDEYRTAVGATVVGPPLLRAVAVARDSLLDERAISASRTGSPEDPVTAWKRTVLGPAFPGVRWHPDQIDTGGWIAPCRLCGQDPAGKARSLALWIDDRGRLDAKCVSDAHDASAIFAAAGMTDADRTAPPGSDVKDRQPADSDIPKPGAVLQPIEVLDLETIARDGMPPISYLYEPWIVEKDVALFAGPAGCGKSTTVAAIAYAAASHGDWLGMHAPRQLRVLYLDEEGDDNTTARMFLKLGRPLPKDQLGVACGQGIRLDTEHGVARVRAYVEAQKPEILVVDSVQVVFGAAEAVSSTAVASIYSTLFALRNDYKLTIVLVHAVRKPGLVKPLTKQEVIRDSSVHGYLASATFVGFPNGPDAMDLTTTKRRGTPKPWPTMIVGCREDENSITLENRGPVEDTDGAVTRCAEWIQAYLEECRGAMKRAEIVKDAAAVPTPGGPYPEDVVDHALRHLLKLGSIEKPARGHYRAKGGHNAQEVAL